METEITNHLGVSLFNRSNHSFFSDPTHIVDLFHIFIIFIVTYQVH